MRRSSRSRAATVLAACVFAIVAGCERERPVAQRPAPEVVTLDVATEAVTLQTELPGRVMAQGSAEVRPQVGGIILERLFTEGSTVRAGQTLYRIDPAPFATTLERAEAALESSRAAVRVSELLLDRYRRLLPEQSISQQDFDNAEAAHAQALASLREREAAAVAARIDLQWTRVTAPIAGRVGRSIVTPGALVSANQATALTTISQLDPVYVDFTQSSADLLRLRRAAMAGTIDRSAGVVANVGLMLEDGSRYEHTGTLRLAEVTVDPSTGAVTLRAEFPNPDGLLLPGMFVRAIVTEGVDSSAVLIPQQALARDRQGRAIVRVVDAEDRIQLRDVVASRTVGARWLVEQGLEAGERIVVEGGQNAAPGTAVRVVPGT